MPKNQDFKRLVRARMKESGERFTEARQSLKESSRLVVAIDTPGLGKPSDFQAKSLKTRLIDAGITPRYPGPQRYRTAAEVVAEIRRVSADVAVLVIQGEGGELLVDEIIDLLDERGGSDVPTAILSSRSRFQSYDALRKGRRIPGSSGSNAKAMNSELYSAPFRHETVPAFSATDILVDWIHEVAANPAQSRETYMRLAIGPQVKGFFVTVAKTLFIYSDARPEEIVGDVEVDFAHPIAVTVETRKPGLLIGRAGETIKWLKESLVEITGDSDIQLHLREIVTP